MSYDHEPPGCHQAVTAQGDAVIVLSGAWTLDNLVALQALASTLKQNVLAASPLIDGSELRDLDTSGAMMLLKFVDGESALEELLGFKDRQLALIRLVQERLMLAQPEGHSDHSVRGVLGMIGCEAEMACSAFLALLALLGESISGLVSILRSPRTFRLRETVAQLEHVFVRAVPISALVTFLIGVVVAYLFASQSEKFGADIFIVDAVSLAMFRELAPLIVAIIVAGRSGSAFTAQIGTMKINEEIDALRSLGLAPLHLLVLPRVVALIIALPFLVFVGGIFGTLGGMAIAKVSLGITIPTFVERLHSVLALKHVWIGLVKAPVFALFIALIGCRLGLAVENNARSVGMNTTATVVQSIVAVILLNAAFAIFFVELGI